MSDLVPAPEVFMETPNASVIATGSRRNEDIALDLMKFIAAHTDVGKTSSVGFQSSSNAKAQEQTEKLLELYGHCLNAVEGKRK
jgi:hypothetical protein